MCGSNVTACAATTETYPASKMGLQKTYPEKSPEMIDTSGLSPADAGSAMPHASLARKGARVSKMMQGFRRARPAPCFGLRWGREMGYVRDGFFTVRKR